MDTYKDEGASARTLIILANWNARRGELHLNETEKEKRLNFDVWDVLR